MSIFYGGVPFKTFLDADAITLLRNVCPSLTASLFQCGIRVEWSP
jgi:hypothetical protein